MKMIYDLIIIGAGPAGLSSGIYAARRELQTLIIEKGLPGGQMLLTSDIQNYPGFSKISGNELAERMESQVKEFGVEIANVEATKLDIKGNMKDVTTYEGEYEGKSIVLATGSSYKKLGVKGEREFTGRGVSYCATCDAPFFKGKIVAVIGGGNSAVSSALYLSEIAEKVYLIHRREQLRAEEARQKELKEKGVKLILNSTVEEILGENLVNSIKIKDTKNETKKIDVDGVFISIGTVPNSGLAKEAGVDLDEKGFIKINKNQETNIEGVFAAGDVTGGVMQISTAIGEGCIAALSAYEYVKKPYWDNLQKG